ncbi:inorganic phosphate transporter [Salinisphaera sp. LB1]|uniref:inorganic phosphate transporter n=1 Tax=Salinisphaera sp. LB1 TaxID=2183911 RepID=UPI000D706C71|nr:inorganic phosphate transporter [Salinisphaera sp. LB1]AWN16786.1 putative low-affinity inorganic phosphate transporter [Salinisphaera sp. LB1]
MSLIAIALIVVAFAFAWSMGAHYTGACMGMPYAANTIRLRPALLLMALFTLLGATFLSHAVLTTVGHGIVGAPRISVGAALCIVAVAFALTTCFNLLRIPTSTIQILVFAVAGVGMSLGLPIRWGTIERLVVLWAAAPLVALVLGFVFTHILSRWPAARSKSQPAIARALVAVGVLASLTMGANDVSNATAVFLSTHLFGVFAAAFVGGLGLALGVLTWGKPLLEKVAFDVVKMDLPMATAAQGVQALVVLAAVAFGYLTSMNQALVGAMAGAGLARGRDTVQWPAVKGILKGWLVGPGAGFLCGYGAAFIVRWTGG